MEPLVENRFRLKARIKLSISHPISSSQLAGPTSHSNFFLFATNKNICVHSLPIDGNPFRSLSLMGHCSGVRDIKVDAARQLLFTIGDKCQSLFMWKINSR